MELIELRQTSATIQCPSCLKHVPEELNMCLCGVLLRPNQSTMDRIRTAFQDLETLYYSTTVILSRGRKVDHGRSIIKEPWMQEEGRQKRHEYTSILDRWQNDEIYRAFRLVHGWTEEWVKYLDYISKIDISHEAPYRQRLRCGSTLYMRGVDSKKQAGPLCQRPD